MLGHEATFSYQLLTKGHSYENQQADIDLPYITYIASARISEEHDII